VGLSDDEFSRIESASLISAPIDQYVDGGYRRGELPNGFAYMFAVGAVALPFLGIVALLLAGRAVAQHRRGAWWALIWSLVLTSCGIALWVFAA
jgi:hypothetical protein